MEKINRSISNVIKTFRELTKELNQEFGLHLDRFIYNNSSIDSNFLLKISSDTEGLFLVRYPDYSYANCTKFDSMLMSKNIKINDLILFIENTVEQAQVQKELQVIKFFPISILMRKVN
jgi:hypothetical protein